MPKEFGDFMLYNAGVSIAPGPVFGNYGEGYVRFCYANSIENIKKALDKMKIALENRNI